MVEKIEKPGGIVSLEEERAKIKARVDEKAAEVDAATERVAASEEVFETLNTEFGGLMKDIRELRARESGDDAQHLAGAREAMGRPQEGEALDERLAVADGAHTTNSSGTSTATSHSDDGAVDSAPDSTEERVAEDEELPTPPAPTPQNTPPTMGTSSPTVPDTSSREVFATPHERLLAEYDKQGSARVVEQLGYATLARELAARAPLAARESFREALLADDEYKNLPPDDIEALVNEEFSFRDTGRQARNLWLTPKRVAYIRNKKPGIIASANKAYEERLAVIREVAQKHLEAEQTGSVVEVSVPSPIKARPDEVPSIPRAPMVAPVIPPTPTAQKQAPAEPVIPSVDTSPTPSATTEKIPTRTEGFEYEPSEGFIGWLRVRLEGDPRDIDVEAVVNFVKSNKDQLIRGVDDAEYKRAYSELLELVEGDRDLVQSIVLRVALDAVNRSRVTEAATPEAPASAPLSGAVLAAAAAAEATKTPEGAAKDSLNVAPGTTPEDHKAGIAAL